MEWNGNTRSFVPQPESSLSFLYNYNQCSYQGKNYHHNTSYSNAFIFLSS